MRKLLNFVLLPALMMTFACSKPLSGDYSGIYIGRDYKYYNPESGKVVRCGLENALYLKSDSTFAYRKCRWIWGNGKWHDTGKEIILSFSAWGDSIPIEKLAYYLSAARWYEGANIILTKKDTDKLMLNLSVLKKITPVDSVEQKELIWSKALL